jgi:ribonuclease BN (tRNA processing enzyme)
MSHGSQYALGYRVQSARGDTWTAAYTGDTGPCEALFELADAASLLVCECSLPSSRNLATHMTPEAVRALAERVRPGLLVLTHLYPEVLEGGLIERAFEGYAGAMKVGYDGLRVSLADGASAQMKLSFPA